MKKSTLAALALAMALPLAASAAMLGDEVTLPTDQKPNKQLTFVFEGAAPSGYYKCDFQHIQYSGPGAYTIASTEYTVVRHVVPKTRQPLPDNEAKGVLVMASDTHPQGAKRIEFNLYTPTKHGGDIYSTIIAKCYGKTVLEGKQVPFDCGNGLVPEDFCQLKKG